MPWIFEACHSSETKTRDVENVVWARDAGLDLVIHFAVIQHAAPRRQKTLCGSPKKWTSVTSVTGLRTVEITRDRIKQLDFNGNGSCSRFRPDKGADRIEEGRIYQMRLYAAEHHCCHARQLSTCPDRTPSIV